MGLPVHISKKEGSFHSDQNLIKSLTLKIATKGKTNKNNQDGNITEILTKL